MNWAALAILPVIIALSFSIGRIYGQAEGKLKERRRLERAAK